MTKGLVYDIQQTRALIKSLNERLGANKLIAEKSPDVKIQIIEDEQRINALHRALIIKTNYAVRFGAKFIEEVEEMNRDYDKVYRIAFAKSKVNKALASLFSSLNKEALSEDENRLYFYKQIKSLI